MKAFVLIIIILFLCGCASIPDVRWYNVHELRSNQENYNRDSASCGNYANAMTRRYSYTSNNTADAIWKAVKDFADRRSYYDTCMGSRGWYSAPTE